jgi:nitrous oxidase accessory protein
VSGDGPRLTRRRAGLAGVAIAGAAAVSGASVPALPAADDTHGSAPGAVARPAAHVSGEAEDAPGRPLSVPTPPRPPSCDDVQPTGHLQQRLDAVAPSGALCLSPGRYPGPIVVRDGRTLWGPPEAVIASPGEGTTVRVEAATLLGVTVDGSGGRFDLLDSAVHVAGEAPRVEGVHVRNATFGILVEKAKHALVRGNRVEGGRDEALGLRGDSIRLWETHHSTVEDNRVTGGRDLVVWYASDNVIRRNDVRDGRYGTHLMYSHRNIIEDNVYVRTVVGVFLMYSRDLKVTRNVAAGAAGAAGMGLGLKESGNVEVRDNVFVRDTLGVYIDNSPMQDGDENTFEGNHFRLCETGVVFLAATKRNVFRDNGFRDNQTAVRVDGGGTAMSALWEGNDFDEYAGYDFDGDGRGDIPFELRSLSADLTSRTPELQFFRGTPALAMLNAASEIVPLLTPRIVLRDAAPRMAPLPLPTHLEALHAH